MPRNLARGTVSPGFFSLSLLNHTTQNAPTVKSFYAFFCWAQCSPHQMGETSLLHNYCIKLIVVRTCTRKKAVCTGTVHTQQTVFFAYMWPIYIHPYVRCSYLSVCQRPCKSSLDGNQQTKKVCKMWWLYSSTVQYNRCR